MYIRLTESAVRQLNQLTLSAEDRIRLVYDTDGCGCAVSGVASLWIVSSPDNDDKRADSNVASPPIYYLERQKVFFEDRLQLDYAPEHVAYRLSSNGQIYGNRILITDHRSQSRSSLESISAEPIS